MSTTLLIRLFVTPLLRVARIVVGAFFAASWALAACVHAAGGHHSVDDAVLMEPGQCQVEVWADRYRAASRGLAHVGPACRFGPFEWGVNLDRATASSETSSFAYGVQAKWARPVVESLTGGLVVAATWQGRAPRRFTGGSVIVPLTWQATDTLLLHANIGRDFRNGAADTSRAGVALEWSPLTDWSLIVERYRESDSSFWRAGTRYAINPNLSLDLSRASDIRSGGGRASSWWTLGVNWAFER